MAQGTESEAISLVGVDSCLGKQNIQEPLLFPSPASSWELKSQPQRVLSPPTLPLSFSLREPEPQRAKTIVEDEEIALGPLENEANAPAAPGAASCPAQYPGGERMSVSPLRVPPGG